MNSTNNDTNDYVADISNTDPVLLDLIEETPVTSIKDLWMLAKIYSGARGCDLDTHISDNDNISDNDD